MTTDAGTGGGWQCGRVWYSVAIDDNEPCPCDWGVCQHATGGVSTAG